MPIPNDWFLNTREAEQAVKDAGQAAFDGERFIGCTLADADPYVKKCDFCGKVTEDWMLTHTATSYDLVQCYDCVEVAAQIDEALK